MSVPGRQRISVNSAPESIDQMGYLLVISTVHSTE